MESEFLGTQFLYPIKQSQRDFDGQIKSFKLIKTTAHGFKIGIQPLPWKRSATKDESSFQCSSNLGHRGWTWPKPFASRKGHKGGFWEYWCQSGNNCQFLHHPLVWKRHVKSPQMDRNGGSRVEFPVKKR